MEIIITFIMKRFFFFIAVLLHIGIASAQTKTAYCDVYMRGGGRHLKTTIMYDGYDDKLCCRYNMGEILNIMAADGWVLDQNIVVPRHHFSCLTRHKLHLIMKKEYLEGESPFAYIEDFRNKWTSEEFVVCNASVDDSTFVNENVATKDASLRVGDKVVYNGVNAKVVKTIDESVVVIVTETKCYGTWHAALEYSAMLGSMWRLLTVDEVLELGDTVAYEAYWMREEVNDYKAKIYDPIYKSIYNKNKTDKYYIVLRAVVDVESLQQVAHLVMRYIYQKKQTTLTVVCFFQCRCRDTRIRTWDPLLPKQVR